MSLLLMGLGILFNSMAGFLILIPLFTQPARIAKVFAASIGENVAASRLWTEQRRYAMASFASLAIGLSFSLAGILFP